MASEIEQAIKFICEEKGLSYEAVMETIETALAAAYRKDYGNRQQNIEIEFNPGSGEMKAFDVKEVVKDVSPEELEAIKQRQAERAAEHEEEEREGGRRGERMESTTQEDDEEGIEEEGD